MLPALLGKINNFWDSQDKLLLQIEDHYQRLIDNYQVWGEAIDDIRKEVMEFNKRVTTSELASIEDTFEGLKNYVNECKDFNESEKKFISENKLPVLRYEKQNMNTLNSLIDIQSTLTKSYLKRRENEKGNDSIEYLSERLKESKVSVIEESKCMTVLKYQCGYANSLLPRETERYFERLSEKLSLMVSEGCYGKLRNLSKSAGV